VINFGAGPRERGWAVQAKDIEEALERVIENLKSGRKIAGVSARSENGRKLSLARLRNEKSLFLELP
jgi:hypothetical protein